MDDSIRVCVSPRSCGLCGYSPSLSQELMGFIRRRSRDLARDGGTRFPGMDFPRRKTSEENPGGVPALETHCLLCSAGIFGSLLLSQSRFERFSCMGSKSLCSTVGELSTNQKARGRESKKSAKELLSG